MHYRYMFCVILLVIGYSSLLAAQDTTSCGVHWQPSMLASPVETEAYTPVIVSQGDTVHMFFLVINSSNRISYRRSCTNGLDWEPIRDIITDTNRFLYTNISYFPTVDRGRLYVFFIGGTDAGGSTPVYMTYSDNRGSDWSEPKAINTNVSFIRSVAVLGDSLAVSGSVDNHPYDRTLYSTDRGITWGYGSAINGSDQRIAITHGWLHMVYSNGDIIYKRSSDLGVTWIDEVNLSMETSVAAVEPEIAAQPNGNIFVVWRDCKYGCVDDFSGSVVFRKSPDNGTSWDEDMPLTETPWGSIKQIYTKDSLLMVSWDSYFKENIIETRLSYDNGNSWCPLINIAQPLRYTAGVPSGTISKKSVVLAWEGRDSLNGPFQIHSRTGLLPVTSVNASNRHTPENFSIDNFFPNPFNGVVTIRYTLPVMQIVTVKVFDMLGQEVATLVNHRQQYEGNYSLTWDANNASSGVYIISVQFGERIVTKKVVLQK